jgi:hypothetical protein
MAAIQYLAQLLQLVAAEAELQIVLQEALLVALVVVVRALRALRAQELLIKVLLVALLLWHTALEVVVLVLSVLMVRLQMVLEQAEMALQLQ